MLAVSNSFDAKASRLSDNVLVERISTTARVKRPILIPYLGGKGYTWITKDDSAKKEHELEIRTAQISIVWISGLERPTNKPKQNFVTIKDLHRMLTDKLDDIQQTTANSNKPQYFTLAMRVDGIPRLSKIALEKFFQAFQS